MPRRRAPPASPHHTVITTRMPLLLRPPLLLLLFLLLLQLQQARTAEAPPRMQRCSLSCGLFSRPPPPRLCTPTRTLPLLLV
jgi:hypothetical protein